ncbi:MerR family transcriptional regulator [Lysinibacillus sp. LZ02]|uniref:MerR family transcriptional regulator n=1 Tax=Lysinibacillus sp. LZ02 TaxID=3420668 RepID=UPI003D361EA9
MYIKQFALKYDLSHDTIRFYEKEGLLHPQRLENGYRFYDVQCEKTIKFILVLKQLGFSLQEIRSLLALDKQPLSEACNNSTVSLFESKMTFVEKQIEFYTAALQVLKMAANVIGKGKYEANNNQIEETVEEMYKKLTKRMD